MGYFPQVGKLMVRDALQAVAQRTRRNPPLECLQDLARRWNPHTPSVIPDLLRAMGVEVTPAYVMKLERYLMGGMRRMQHPGCQMDNMLILGGKEAKKKSSTLKILFDFPEPMRERYQITGEFFSNNPPPLTQNNDDKARVHLIGLRCVEFAEMSSLKKTEVEHFKTFVTTSQDRVCRKYDRETTTYPRSCILAGTTNLYHYDPSNSGSRRLWHIPITKVIDLDRVRELWEPMSAEMFYRANIANNGRGEKYWVDEDEDAEFFKEEQEEHRNELYAEAKLKEMLSPWLDDDDKLLPDVGIPGMSLLDCNELSVHLGKTRMNGNGVRSFMESLGAESHRPEIGGRKTTIWTRIGGDRRPSRLLFWSPNPTDKSAEVASLEWGEHPFEVAQDRNRTNRDVTRH